MNNNVIYGEASVEINDDDKIIVKVKLDNDNELQRENVKNKDYIVYEAENLLIATGARPFIPNIDGVKYALTSSDVLSLEEVPSKLNIVGGGIIATELSNLFSSFGSEVKIIARSEILKELEPEIKSYVVKKLMNRDDVTGICFATDAGREGELIARLAYKMAGCKKPVVRLWISSITAIKMLRRK